MVLGLASMLKRSLVTTHYYLETHTLHGALSFGDLGILLFNNNIEVLHHYYPPL